LEQKAAELKAKQDAYLTMKAAGQADSDDGKKLLDEFEKLESEAMEMKMAADALNLEKANREAAAWAEAEAELERIDAEAAEEEKRTFEQTLIQKRDEFERAKDWKAKGDVEVAAKEVRVNAMEDGDDKTAAAAELAKLQEEV